MKYTKDLDFFVDKVCTIIVRDINWRYKVENMIDYFVGFVSKIDENYIWTRHATTGGSNCIDLEAVVSLHEEQVLYEEKVEDKKLIEEFKAKKPESNPAKFVNIKELSELAKKSRLEV